MSYPDYLIHFNKLHSKKNGQFISGDGDGDGTADEHHRYTKDGRKVERRLNALDYRKNSKINKIKRSSQDYANEFDTTKEGKKLISNKNKADKKFNEADSKLDPYVYYYGNKKQKKQYELDSKKRDDALMDYWREEKKENIARGEYIAKSLINKYGEKKVAELSFFDHDTDPSGKVRKSSIIYKDTDDLIKKYAEIYWRSETFYNEDMHGPLD